MEDLKTNFEVKQDEILDKIIALLKSIDIDDVTINFKKNDKYICMTYVISIYPNDKHIKVVSQEFESTCIRIREQMCPFNTIYKKL